MGESNGHESEKRQESPTESSDNFLKRWESLLVASTIATGTSAFASGQTYAYGQNELALGFGVAAAGFALMAISAGLSGRHR